MGLIGNWLRYLAVMLAVVTLIGCDNGPAGKGPNVISVSLPKPGLYRTGQVITLKVTFSAPVKVTGEPSILLKIGDASRALKAAPGSGGTAIPFSYALIDADNDADGLTLAADKIAQDKENFIKDEAGRAIVAQLPSLDMGQVRVNNDSSAPKILRITGPDQTYGADQDVNMMVQFDEMIDVKGGKPVLHVLVGGIERQAVMLPNPPGSSNLVFQLKPETGDFSPGPIKPLPPIDAGGAMITDGNNNPADLSFASNQVLLLTKVDARLPVLKEIEIKPGMYRKGDIIPITLHFDKRMTAWRRYDEESPSPDQGERSSRGAASRREPLIPQYARPRAGMPPMELSSNAVPKIQLNIDGAHVSAPLDQSTNGSEDLVFNYKVRGRDEDLDGLVIKAELDQAGSVIMDDGGNLFDGVLAKEDIKTEVRMRNPVRFACPRGATQLPGRNGCLITEVGQTQMQVPDDVESITVRVWGAGGGGGAKNGRGGAGGYVKADIKVEPLSKLQLNVPSGGGRGINTDQPSGGGGGGYALVADSSGKPLVIAAGGGGGGGALFAPDQGGGGAGGGLAGEDGQNGIGDNSCAGGTGGGPEVGGLGGGQSGHLARDGQPLRGGSGDPQLDNSGGMRGGPGGTSPYSGGGGGGGWRGGGGGCQSLTLYSHGGGGGGGSSYVDKDLTSRVEIEAGKRDQPPHTVIKTDTRDPDYQAGRGFGGHPDNNFTGGDGLIVVRFN